jgi:deazaflavin-dependent oxidoreductase (nitroreductase family)
MAFDFHRFSISIVEHTILNSREEKEMKFPKGARAFNKRFLNRLTGRIARSSWGPFSVIYHTGRRSGKSYQTPIIAIPIADGFVVALTYGPDVDWYRNVSSAGQCRILWHRHESVIVKIEPMVTKTAIPYFPVFERKVLRLIGTEHFVKLIKQTATSG